MTKNVDQMTMVEMARALADLGQTDKALEAYTAALKQTNVVDEERLEAACAVLQYGEDYRPAYDAFLALYRSGVLRENVLSILTEAFYLPNVRKQEKQYKKNCKLLQSYPYLFRRDFLPFEALPLQFFPYDDTGVLPFCRREECFQEYTNVTNPVVTHYFFKDLEHPVLAHDIFSQYELEYLKDNVRRSDWVGRENHIYLHYSDWGTFCAYLALLDMRPVLEEEKVVFLIEDEETLYPIDFKARFGIDYRQCPVKPFHIREFHKLIWHTQLSSHNGGDFFNEILHDHPHLVMETSILFRGLMESFQSLCRIAAEHTGEEISWDEETRRSFNPDVLQQLATLRHVSVKDAMVAYYLGRWEAVEQLDPSARIVPALFFQPHFAQMNAEWTTDCQEAIQIETNAGRELEASGIFQQFRYIKTFTPLRRPTTSYAATVRFNEQSAEGMLHSPEYEGCIIESDDPLVIRLLNWTFLVDGKSRAFADSRLVRFEDAKQNPTAVFTALAEFLDIPYTESMTYCSDKDGRDPAGVGFSTAAVHRTYDEFADVYERRLIEYLMREVYQTYGYDFHYYDGKPMTSEQIDELLERCQTALAFSRRTMLLCRDRIGAQKKLEGEALDAYIEELWQTCQREFHAKRQIMVKILRSGLPFCNENGDPLHFMTPLTLDSALLETELYH